MLRAYDTVRIAPQPPMQPVPSQRKLMPFIVTRLAVFVMALLALAEMPLGGGDLFKPSIGPDRGLVAEDLPVRFAMVVDQHGPDVHAAARQAIDLAGADGFPDAADMLPGSSGFDLTTLIPASAGIRLSDAAVAALRKGFLSRAPPLA